MKYKVGDKVRVRRDLRIGTHYGAYFASGMDDYKGGVVTIWKTYSNCYCIEEDIGTWIWTDEMFDGLVGEELTAEEAIKIQAEMCRSIMCKDCEIDKFRYDSHCECAEFRSKNPKKVIEILKQWKKDHEKKEIETEIVRFMRLKIVEKVINDYEIKEIALNPAYLANDDLKNLKNQGFCVRWMRENEGSDKNIFTLIVEEN